MARTDKTESTTDLTGTASNAAHHQGLQSAQARAVSGPVLGDRTDRGPAPAARGRTGFASAGGWVIAV